MGALLLTSPMSPALIDRFRFPREACMLNTSVPYRHTMVDAQMGQLEQLPARYPHVGTRPIEISNDPRDTDLAFAPKLPRCVRNVHWEQTLQVQVQRPWQRLTIIIPSFNIPVRPPITTPSRIRLKMSRHEPSQDEDQVVYSSRSHRRHFLRIGPRQDSMPICEIHEIERFADLYKSFGNVCVCYDISHMDLRLYQTPPGICSRLHSPWSSWAHSTGTGITRCELCTY